MNRLSIEPTYDSRNTGPRFEVETYVQDKFVSRTKLADPFVRHVVRVSILDSLWSLLRFGCVKVRINVNADPQLVEDVMELDANYIGHGSTRRSEWNKALEVALADFKGT